VTCLADKVLIITGASRGIGAAAARLFAEPGATVVLAARDEHALTELASEIAWDDREAYPVPTDVTNASAVERLVAATVDRYGRLDGAFNNAGDGTPPHRSPRSNLPSSTEQSTSTCAASSSACAPNSHNSPRAGRS
jgi:NADP-dependent 3-hydroxy acid dehydrogenase YdfG